MRLLHVAPHPDDEILGAGATLMALRDAGWRIDNYAVSLGRAAERERHRDELAGTCERAGFGLLTPPPLDISAGDDLGAAQSVLAAHLQELVAHYDIVVSPSPHDLHHGHELVGRAVAAAVKASASSWGLPRWWMWGLWGELPLPNIISGFLAPRLAELEEALSAHAGAEQRNNYPTLLAARARANAVGAGERVFGFGSPGLDLEYAEVCCEIVYDRERDSWLWGAPRILDPSMVLAAPTDTDIGFWISGQSLAQRLRFRQKVEGRAVRWPPDAADTAL